MLQFLVFCCRALAPKSTEIVVVLSSSSGSELSSVGDVNSDGKRDTRATRVNVVVPDVMLLDLVGMARREIYELDVSFLWSFCPRNVF
jgi:hypothetical protein